MINWLENFVVKIHVINSEQEKAISNHTNMPVDHTIRDLNDVLRVVYS